MSFQYDVFFSYRHKPLDAELTQKAFNAVESYRLPRRLLARGCENIRRAFRDTEELPVSRILTDTIDQALRSTRCLIVVCSTDTPSSEWIDREVSTFIELGRAEHIYPLLITGDPEHSFPPSLKLVPDILERVMDVRVPGNPVKKMMEKAETELLRVISDVAGCTETELAREHKLRRNRRFAARAAASLAAFAAVAGISLGLMNRAQAYRDVAQTRESASMRILNELTYSLPDHLTNVPGAYSRIAGILERNTEDINAILRLSADADSAEFEAAANYEKLANASAVLGRYEDALEAEDRAVEIFGALADRGVPGSGEALASAFNNRAIFFEASGRYEEAAAAYAEAIARQERAGGDRLTLARMYRGAGSSAISLGRDEEAAASLDACLALLSETGTGTDEALETAVLAHYNYGSLLYRQGRYPEAEEHLRSSCAYCDELLGRTDSLQNQALYVKSAGVLANVLRDTGSFEEADRFYARAIKKAETLALDAENTANQRDLALLYNYSAVNSNTLGDYAHADELYLRSVEIWAALAEKTGTASDRSLYALTLINTGENAFKLQDYAASRRFFEQGLDVYASALDELGDYDRALYQSWLSYYRLVILRDYPGALEASLTALELQPKDIQVKLILGYACLYNGNRDAASAILNAVAALGEGQAEMIRRDLAAQRQAGMDPGFEFALNAP
ncbi:MAG: tetratricopeptide repeat protein [Oscillospiraceae bacterium]|nr:tetratricopeptide repeat protein [Oscillospiraceae bacterium]